MTIANRILLASVLIFSFSPTIFAMEAEAPPRKKARIARKPMDHAPRNLYDPTAPFKMSRTKLELFLKCPRCFYRDCKEGKKRPDGYPFTLNNAVDALLKKEFDCYRKRHEPHPLCLENHVNAIPYDHPDLEKWRDSLHYGVQYAVPGTNIIFYGGLDDVWLNLETNELIVVDYKATSKEGMVSIDAEWQIDYKHQVEIYQWLLRQNGFPVSETAYFVYCNATKSRDRFDARLNFDISLIPYKGETAWIPEAVHDAWMCLQEDKSPPPSTRCPYCRYISEIINLKEDPGIDVSTQYPESEET